MLPLPDLRLPMMLLPRPPRLMPRPSHVAGLVLTAAVINGAMLATGAAIGVAAVMGGKMAMDRMRERRSGASSEPIPPEVSAEIERDLNADTGL